MATFEIVERPGEEASGMKGQTIKVLLIDDDEDDYILTAELLSKTNAGAYQLDWASSYEEGLRLAVRRDHHVCLVDYRLGERSGVELIREVRESRVTTPMILLTGQGDHDVDIEAMEAGATDYLIKDQTSSARLERTIRYAVQLYIERGRVEAELAAYAQRRVAVAEIGCIALTGGKLKNLLDEAVALVARTLGVEYCKVLELLPAGDALILRAGVGWKEDYPIGKATVSSGKESQAGFTLLSNEPVVVEDLRKETRFNGPLLLHEHGVVSGMSVIIRGRGRAYGVMGAHTTSARRFADDEVNFLVAVANVLAEAIDRKRSEESLKQSETRMSEAQRIAHLGSWEWDVREDRTHFSEELYRIFGLQPHELGTSNESITTHIHPEDQPVVARGVAQALKDKIFPDLEYRVRRSDGTVRVVQANGGVILDENGQIVKMVGTAQDITERKRAEETLRKSEEQYRTLFDSIDEGFCTIEVLFDENDKPVDYRFLEVNPAFELQTGIQNGAGRSMREIAPLHEEHWFELYGKIALTGEPARFENPAAELHRWYDVYAFRVGEPQERKVAIRFSDITKRKRTEEALRESEERYRLLFEQNPHPMWVFDLETLFFLEVNDAAIQQYGYAREEFLAMTIEDIRPPEDIPKLHAILSDPNEEKAGIWRHQKKDGTIIDVEISAHKLIPYARPAQIVLAYDVTERRTLEEQLRQSQKLEAVGTLAGGIAHDFNNILGAIIGYSELAQVEITESNVAYGHLDQVLKASARATDLVRQILTFSRRGEHGQVALQLQPLIDETLKLLRASLPSTIEIRQNIDAAAPSVLGDATQIQQVIMNLGFNARQAMQERAGVLEISLTCLDIDSLFASAHPELNPGPHIRLTISDTGCGMDGITQARIFEPFFTTKAPGEGTGLGLAVVHGIISNHGGVITVHSEPEIGTTFNIYLSAYDGQMGAAAEQCVAVSRGNGEHILFVDDEEALVSVGKSILENLGYRVTTSTNSVEALAAFSLQPRHFDLVITDQTMPHLNGADLASALLRIRPGLPVIMTTGYSTAISPEKARAIGVRELLSKPNTTQTLGEATRRALGQSNGE
ncbi:MAG: PAS domain S-box protein [Pyrinomonadaceae bacterium]|nr:PAS domain S-box protein [Pyrinomonadaceae bacterium]